MSIAFTLLARGLGAVNRTQLAVFRVVTIGLVMAISLVVAAGVFWRYVLNDALSWYEEVAKFMMVWLAFTGGPLASMYGAHAGIEVLPNLAGRRMRQLVLASIAGFSALLLGGLTYQGWLFAWNARSQVALTVGDLSMFWIFVAIPVGCAGMGLVAMELALSALHRFLRPSEIPSDNAAKPSGDWSI